MRWTTFVTALAFVEIGTNRHRTARALPVLVAALCLAAAIPDSALAQVRGDFNGDGVGDLAIGAPNEGIVAPALVNGQPGQANMVNAGTVTVIYGTVASGLVITSHSPTPQLIHQDIANVLDSVEENDQFGAALAVGNFNGDNFDDLIVSVPGDNAIQIFHGSNTGLDLAGDRMIDGTPFFDNQGNPMPIMLRPALVRGNFNGDAFDDLAVAALVLPGSFLGRPSVLVMSGGTTGVQSFSGRIISFNISAIAVEVGERRETSLAAGDFSGDGADDLAVGLPDLDVADETGANMLDAGAVTVLQGLPATGGPTTGGITVQGATSLTELDAQSVPQFFEGFGAVLAAGDFDGDGSDDLAVGTPQEDVVTSSGNVVREGGLVAVFSHATTLHGVYTHLAFSQNPQAFDNFGAALATGDFNGDGAADLAIGTPGDVILNQTGAGSVTVTYGRLNLGLPRPAQPGLPQINGPTQTFTQATADIADSPEKTDHFGQTLWASDVGSTAHADLIIGVPDEDLLVTVGVGSLVDPVRTETRANVGALHVLYGSNALLQAAGSHFVSQNSSGVPDSAEAGDRFGSALP